MDQQKCHSNSKSSFKTCNGCRKYSNKSHRVLMLPTTFTLRITMIWILLVADFLSPVWTWTHHPTPNSKVILQDTDVGIQRYGGRANITDDFHIILIEQDSFIVGARNMAYNLSLNTLKESLDYRITWKPKARDQRMCLDKKKTLDQCQNYIRVVVRKQDKSVYICGTNAFKPRCRSYTHDNDQLKITKEEKGVGLCPLDPSHNSTFTYAGGRLYAGTVVDFIGQTFLIYRDNNLMTEQRNSRLLNHPDFVKSFSYEDKVYFFFREVAVENTNCEKTVFSRIARVCKNDKGGGIILEEEFTSFFKSRLNCSIPGDFPFYFNEIQSVSDLGQGNYMSTFNSGNRSEMVYAVFNTPMNSISGSAICAFSFSDIVQSFRGKFKGQRRPHHNWLSVPDSETPSPHPTSCTEDSTKLTPTTLTFIKSHPLMDASVPPSGGAPVFLVTGVNYRFTAVAVDWQRLAAGTRYYDVIFIGTDNGRVLKALNKGWDANIKYNLIEDIEVFPDGRPITRLHIHRRVGVGEEKLIVVSRNEIVSIPLHRCHTKKTCAECVALQDPYCSWTEDSKCANTNIGLQDLRSNGTHSLCKDKESTKPRIEATTSRIPTCAPCVCPGRTAHPEQNMPEKSRDPRKPIKNGNSSIVMNEPRTRQVTEKTSGFSVETLAISIVVSIVVSLIAGFLIGYRVSICRHPPPPPRDVSFPEKVDLHKTCNKTLNTDSTSSNQLNYSDSYQPKQLNVVLNVKGTKHPVETKPVHSGNKVYL